MEIQTEQPLSPQPPQVEQPLNGIQSNEIKWATPYVFRLRKQMSGPFPGLWELVLLDPSQAENVKVIKTIDDANGLTYCIDNLQGELEGDGL